jgi:hypothetical protein
MVSNFLVGGKLGDFIHAMYTVKNLCQINQRKANLYLIDDEWELGVQLAYRELKELMLSQEYIESVSLLDDSNKPKFSTISTDPTTKESLLDRVT